MSALLHKRGAALSGYTTTQALHTPSPCSLRTWDIARTRNISRTHIKKEYLLVMVVVALVEMAVGFNSWYFNATDLTPYPSDAFSRTANAYYVLFCDPPSLANVGTVWNPLPSILEIPFVWFAQFWKPLVSYGLAGVMLTSLFAGATAALLVHSFRLFGTSRVVSYLICALYVFNPFIFFYGYNGMSETIAYFFIILTIHLLLRWMVTGKPFYVSAMGFTLMALFFTRYEAIPFALGVWLAMMVFIWTSKRESRYVVGGKWEKLHYCEATSVILAMPIIYGVALWILFNWVIKGDALYFLNSAYSNSVQSNYAAQFASVPEMIGGIAEKSAPFFVVFAFIVFGRLATKRLFKPETLMLCCLVGSLFVFHVFMVASGKSYCWLRFFSYALPVCMAWLAFELPALQNHGLSALAARAGAIVALVATFAICQYALHAFDYEVEEDLPLFRQIATYIEDKVEPETLLCDSFMTGGILMQLDSLDHVITSANPTFDATVADPVRMEVAYVLVPELMGVGGSDALLTKDPELGSGQNIEGYTLVQEFAGKQSFYLYKLEY